ncbi:MAG: hypothetical protein MUF15_25425 [Acidobacteria bacterium]|nr:hypothetical protein [Acidobacteriota bacterium]
MSEPQMPQMMQIPQMKLKIFNVIISVISVISVICGSDSFSSLLLLFSSSFLSFSWHPIC